MWLEKFANQLYVSKKTIGPRQNLSYNCTSQILPVEKTLRENKLSEHNDAGRTEVLHLGSPCKPLTQGSNIFCPPQLQMDLQNMEIFAIKNRHHCCDTKRLRTIIAEEIKQMHRRKEKILPRVLKQVCTTY